MFFPYKFIFYLALMVLIIKAYEPLHEAENNALGCKVHVMAVTVTSVAM